MVLVLLLVVVQLIFHGGTASFAGGLVLGVFYGLIALGMVLVYRSNRIINFAQISMGSLSVTLLTQVLVHNVVIKAIGGLCSSCAASPSLALISLQYALAMVLSLLVAPLIGLLMYVVVRLLGDASRLVVTVAMIGAGLLLDWGAGQVQQLINGPQAPGTFPSVDVRPPQNMSFDVAGAIWDTGTITTLAVTAAVLVSLVLFFTRSRLGVAIRASSENEERARSLGISPAMVQATVWAIAGLLAGLAANLSAMVSGSGGSGGTTVSVLLIALAAAVVGRFESLVMTMVAAIVLGIVEYATIVANVTGGIADLVVALVIITVLMLRPAERVGRAEMAAGSWLTTREVRTTPSVLRGLLPVRRWRLGVGILVAATALGAPYVLSASDTVQASQFLIFGIVGLSLVVVSGWAGQISLGQFAISAVGAYVTAVLGGSAGLPVVITVPAGAIAGAAVSMLVALPSLRLRGAYLAVTTLALAQVVATVLFDNSLLGRFLPTQLTRFSVFGLDGSDNRVFYYTLLVAAAICCVLVRGLRRSRTGRALIASRDNEHAVQSFGVSLPRARIQAFVFAGFLAGGAGSLYAYLLGTVDAGGFSPQFSETILLMAVLGGLGSLAGPFLGTVYLAVATFVFSSTAAVDAAIGIAVLTLLVLAPGGVSQVVYAGRDAFLRRVAERFDITVPSLISSSRLDSSGRNRTPMLPKRTRTGSTEFVPERYRLDAVPENVAALRMKQS